MLGLFGQVRPNQPPRKNECEVAIRLRIHGVRNAHAAPHRGLFAFTRLEFDDVDVLAVTDIYPASEKPLPGVTGETILDEVRSHGVVKECVSTPTMLKARDVIGNLLRPGDVFMTLGAGNVHEVGTCIARDLKIVEALWSIIDQHGGGVVKLY